ncbi:nucleophile aminohydrolase [Diplogelasinospora grovesii]|uniref:Nucleophile aminohydrolase n=1 Tax=Diplogelasinospora grovesii TaxID=303347 RepID=A0AAN6MZI1_9PEZI|nr:nucleophile aminohydrolase [Diplogelasinospora grovesii]
MDHGPHTMLVGRAADETTKKLGFDVVANNYFTTPFRKAYWDQTSRLGQRDAGSEMGTVGAIVLDSYGHLAAGGSTGGPTGKIDGRIGDTAILGAGLYADARLGVVCSGEGDQIFKQLVAANVAKYHALGSSLSDAARQALRHISATGASCALAATCLYPTTFPVLPSHEFYKDDQLLIGHSRYPTTLGHTLAIVESGADLFSLQPAEFVDALTKISTTA